MVQPSETIDCQDFALRRWRAESDFDALFRMIEESLDHLRPWMPWVARHGRQHTREFLADCDPKWQSGDAYNYAITANDALVGSISLYRADEPQGRFMGYWLHPAAVGRGIATRAAAAVVSEAFASLPDVAYVDIVHDLANAASGAVPRRLGFTEVRREQVSPPVAPGDSGTDVIWRLNRPGSPLTGTARP
ncbi:GNAT family N-acetyltransferase [Streptomyces sp. PKU-EA00015]|uniref:GNAT family N-acetyltransferase n=1 Tax=Streptomyces sp. PKU-EA00015 TaxID=2748326 RepID=UPI0015A236B7|nr:GNAT family N-acetyltransferase [Streptomyces sp. PKU-EA00015]NWF25572.1 GNAT family N-acetyltransferase [Streptomyces sp. PKU-EA00015]